MNNITLYNLTNGFIELMDNEEISTEDKIKIEKELNIMLEQKSGNIIGFTKNVEATIEAIKNEEKRLAENRKAMERKLERFKDYVKECMTRADIVKVETMLGTLTVAKNPMSIEIIDEDAIPSEYKQEVTTTKIDKKAILDNFKSTGELIEGVVVNADKTSLRIR